MYREYPPDIRLAHLIETYWVVDRLFDVPLTQRIMPDGCVDIIFDFGNSGIGFPKLVGTMTNLLEISYRPGRVHMMGIRFAPGGITAFTSIPVYEMTNRNIELPLRETIFDTSFYESLQEMSRTEERIAYLNRYFAGNLDQLYLPDKQISYAVSLIRNSKKQLTVKQLATEACLCQRHFERKFKISIGISPKTFSSIIRFQSARDYLKMHPAESLSSASLACGYYDLSHMNKEFRTLASLSPSEL